MKKEKVKEGKRLFTAFDILDRTWEKFSSIYKCLCSLLVSHFRFNLKLSDMILLMKKHIYNNNTSDKLLL